MKQIKYFVILLQLVYIQPIFAIEPINSDIETRIHVLENTINNIQKSLMHIMSNEKAHLKHNGIEDKELLDEIKELHSSVNKLELKVDKNNTRLQILQEKISIDEKNIDNISISNKDEYVMNHLAKEIEATSVDQDVMQYQSTEASSSIDKTHNPTSDYQKAYLLLKKKDSNGKIQYTKVQEAFEVFIAKYPNHPLQGNAYYWLGELYMQQNHYRKAAIEYLNGYKVNIKSGRAIDSLIGLSMALSKLSKHNEVCSTINKLFNEFPDLNSENKREADNLYKSSGCINE